MLFIPSLPRPRTQAIVAVAVLVRNLCGDVEARQAAFDSLFLSREMSDPSTVLL